MLVYPPLLPYSNSSLLPRICSNSNLSPISPLYHYLSGNPCFWSQEFLSIDWNQENSWSGPLYCTTLGGYTHMEYNVMVSPVVEPPGFLGCREVWNGSTNDHCYCYNWQRWPWVSQIELGFPIEQVLELIVLLWSGDVRERKGIAWESVCLGR